MEGGPVLEVVESPTDADDAIRANAPLPDALPVLPLRETVTFPDTMTPLAVGQERSTPRTKSRAPTSSTTSAW